LRWAPGARGQEPRHHFIRLKLLLTFSLVLVSLLLGQSLAVSAEQPYLDELVRRAKGAKLAQARYWHLLLHYRPTIWGGTRSEADDPGFFLSPSGKTDPESELAATLAAFFSNELVGRSRQPAQCAFIARYEWLKDKLQFDPQRLPPITCPRFEDWLREINPEGVSLIFPSSYMNNPSSMFGHTLLRFDQKGQTEQTRILAYTVNYAADVPPDAGIAFAIKGIAGGYKGFFSSIPYYLKVKEYRDLENRDIWEYQLNFADAQVRRMITHAWELGNAYFDYYFFKENCAYHILALLEIGSESLHLRDRFFLWTIPADTIRLLAEQPGTIRSVTYRPSRSTQIRRKREALSGQERRWLTQIVRDPAMATSPSFIELPAERRALLMDIASDSLLYASVKDSENAQQYWNKNISVLSARSQLAQKSPLIPIRPLAAPPEQGHRTFRAGAGVGWRQDELFEELNVRLAYHDLLDPDAGYLPDAQIELGSLAVRHYERSEQFRVERFTLANIVSLSPIEEGFLSPSWKVNGGMQSVRHTGCRYCSIWTLNGGPGAAVETHLLNREVYFAFAEAEASVGSVYQYDHRFGAGGTAGVLANVTDRWKILASASYLRFPLGERSEDIRAFVGQRYTIHQNLALRFEFSHRKDDNELLFLVHAFF
jgi:hypothetical protein